MGYAMSRHQLDAGMLDSGQASGFYVTGSDDEQMLQFDNEIRQLTNLRIEPNEPIRKVANSRKDVPVSTAKMLLGRESNWSGRGKFTSSDRCHVVSRYLPTSGPWHVDRMSSKAYVSQFSTDGLLFVAAFQGSHLRVYNVEKGWKIQKDILARSIRWTVTDTSLSPDRRFLVYASLSPIVHIVNVEGGAAESYANINELHDGLVFSMNNDEEYFGIFSVKFSIDGRELVAGSNDDSIYVFDLQTNKVSLRINAHSSDVNSVTFADETGHVLYSGSDDGLCKVWDRRCFIDNDHPAGVLVGHLEGITFIDSRGDGRYLISNGKDQTTKLWDIRKMSNNVHCPRPESQWDYRWMEYPYRGRKLRHPSDQSLATYRGHSVLHTLVRCYFSPAYSTGQRYIYTGSSDNCVYIYDMVSGNQVAKLEYHDHTVRDCSWHPYYPTLVSSAWDGLVVRWEFSGSSDEPAQPRRRRRHIY